jgi:hypothetical protein
MPSVKSGVAKLPETSVSVGCLRLARELRSDTIDVLLVLGVDVKGVPHGEEAGEEAEPGAEGARDQGPPHAGQVKGGIIIAFKQSQEPVSPLRRGPNVSLGGPDTLGG